MELMLIQTQTKLESQLLLPQSYPQLKNDRYNAGQKSDAR